MKISILALTLIFSNFCRGEQPHSSIENQNVFANNLYDTDVCTKEKSNLPEAPDKIIDFIIYNMADGFGDISNTLITAAWVGFYNKVNGIDAKIRFTTSTLNNNLGTPGVNYENSEIRTFINKFYGGNLSHIYKLMCEDVKSGRISFTNKLNMSCDYFENNEDFYLYSDFKSKSSHIISMTANPYHIQYLYPLIAEEKLKSITLSAEYDHVDFVDTGYKKAQELIANFQDRKTSSELPYVENTVKKLYAGFEHGKFILTPLPAERDHGKLLEFRNFIPSKIKEYQNVTKVVMLYVKFLDINMVNLVHSSCANFNDLDSIAIIIPGTASYPQQEQLDTFKSNSLLNKYCRKIIWLDQVFIPNTIFNAIISDPQLDTAVVTGDQSLGSVLSHLPLGKDFYYETVSHKQGCLEGLKNRTFVEYIGSYNRFETLHMFKLLTKPNIFKLEDDVYESMDYKYISPKNNKLKI